MIRLGQIFIQRDMFGWFAVILHKTGDRLQDSILVHHRIVLRVIISRKTLEKHI